MIIDFFDYPNEFPTMKWDIFYQFTIQFFKKFCIKNSNIPDYYSQKTEKIQSKKMNLPPFFLVIYHQIWYLHIYFANLVEVMICLTF